MKRQPVSIDPGTFPDTFHSLLADAPVFDSSCSPEARVYYIEKEDGFYLKTAPKGSLKAEASMARYFHRLELGPELCAYESREQDWLLTRRAVGEDCTHPRYLEDPKRLCEATALLCFCGVSTICPQKTALFLTERPITSPRRNVTIRQANLILPCSRETGALAPRRKPGLWSRKTPICFNATPCSTAITAFPM